MFDVHAPAATLLIEGTSVRVVPHEGGLASGLMGWAARREARRLLAGGRVREAVSVKTVAADWAAVNGWLDRPQMESVSGHHNLNVDRLSWAAPGRPPVVVYRLEGAGHGWPGGPRYAPAVLVGRIPASLDATGIVLEFVHQQATRE